MNEEISLNKFADLVGYAWAHYPNAKVSSVGTGMDKDRNLYFILFLDCDGKEIKFKIPCYMEVK